MADRYLAGLWLCRHHRGVRRKAASRRHRARGAAHVAALLGRRIGAARAAAAGGGDRLVPRHAAVLSVGRGPGPRFPPEAWAAHPELTRMTAEFLNAVFPRNVVAATPLIYAALG